MTSRRVSALRAGSQMPQTDGEIYSAYAHFFKHFFISVLGWKQKSFFNLLSSRQKNILVRLPETVSVGKAVHNRTMSMCYWQSSTLCLTSLGALGLSVHRMVQRGGKNTDSALCPANMTEPSSLAESLMVLKEFFDQYNQGYQHIREHQHGTLTFIHAWKQVTIKITPWPCQYPKADHTWGTDHGRG